jgi:hypothetical protein
MAIIEVLVFVGVLLVIVDGFLVFGKYLSTSSKTQSLLSDYRAYVRGRRIAPYEEFIESRHSGLALVIAEDAMSLNALQEKWDLAYSQS